MNLGNQRDSACVPGSTYKLVGCTINGSTASCTHIEHRAWNPTNDVTWTKTLSRLSVCPSGSKLDPNGSGMCVELHAVDKTLAAPSCKSPGKSNPVYPLTGTKKEFVATGVSLGSLALTLTYDTTSKLPANQADTLTLSEPAPFGPLWKSSLHRRLQVSAGLKSALISRGDGSILNFSGDGSGSFVDTGDHAHKLVALGAGSYRFTDMNTASLETFGADGALTKIETATGEVFSFAYASGNLMSVQDNTGRSIRFTFDDHDRVIKVAGAAYALGIGYDAHGNLATLKWPDGKSQGFLYENAALPWALTGKRDENNSRFATFTYDAQGRATSSEHAQGTERYQFAYPQPAQRMVADVYDAANQVFSRTSTWTAPGSVIVIAPNGQMSTLDAQVVAGAPALTSQTQPAGSGCAASISAVSYDSNGNVTSRDDFQGARTCYAYDSASREIARIEGLPSGAACAGALDPSASLPAGARRIATGWHPDWRLPVMVTEPLRRVSVVYHGQPDPFAGNAIASCAATPLRSDSKPLPLVCKSVEEALAPAGGVDPLVPAKASTYTYNNQGKLLSSTASNGHATSYTYHAGTQFNSEPPSAYDEHYDSVVLLIDGDGANGSTAIVDKSRASRVLQAAGNAQISTAQSKFGGSSLYFDGSGDSLLAQSSFDFSFGSGDFTVEFWVWTHPSGAGWMRILENEAYNITGGWHFSFNGLDAAGNRRLGFQIGLNGGGGARIDTAAALPASQWVHIAVARASGTIRMFVNGVVQPATISSSENYTSQRLRIGSELSSGSFFLGYLDDIRLTKGRARYTANFAVPSHALPPRGMIASHSDVGTSIGDLQTVTNPAGHVTTYNLYDPAGRVRRMTDAKGVVTDITYTPRGWVSTVTVTPPGGPARTTTYTYDFVGQLTGTTQPDGTTVSYTYDAAHRLTGATDNRGNAITYTLDNTGNRTGEEVRDPGGSLQRSIARSFDALNRLQQITGAAR